ncbi:MAG: response regulator [Candidatus Pacebacteria bacterium]|nr:response regulator [Candidatus Paceibacterota bacterium]
MNSSKNRKILVIEDEATLQRALNEVLSKEGYEVVSALDGLKGLELVQRENPDLILLDIILPKMDGFEVLKKIKENGEISKIPIIILTNLSDVNDIQKALDLGATTYLVKADFHIEDVLKKIEKVLSI